MHRKAGPHSLPVLIDDGFYEVTHMLSILCNNSLFIANIL